MTEQTVLALITCQTYPEPSDNLKTLAAHLETMGVKTVFDAWQNHPSATFLLPLCAWDYAAEPEAFRQWLEQAEQAGQRFINPPELMAWNMEKTYLCDLAERGSQVIPSMFVPPQKAELADILNQQGWTEAVIKPAFGQSGKGVVKVCAEELDVNMADYPQGMIVQPYIREIETAGETSLVFSTAYSAMPCAVSRRKANGAPTRPMACRCSVLSPRVCHQCRARRTGRFAANAGLRPSGRYISRRYLPAQ